METPRAMPWLTILCKKSTLFEVDDDQYWVPSISSHNIPYLLFARELTVSSILNTMLKKNTVKCNSLTNGKVSTYLLLGVTAGVARENVPINVMHAASPGVVDGGGSVGVSVAA
jgi:hypothetical protein